MTDFSKYDEYEPTQEDIDKVVHMLSYTDPERATQENAKKFIAFHQAYFHEAGHVLTDEEMLKLYKTFADKGFKD
jgi:hypothetical protein